MLVPKGMFVCDAFTDPGFSRGSERLHSAPHRREEEPDGDRHGAAAVRHRDHRRDQAGGHPAAPGLPGGPRRHGRPAHEQGRPGQRPNEGTVERYVEEPQTASRVDGPETTSVTSALVLVKLRSHQNGAIDAH